LLGWTVLALGPIGCRTKSDGADAPAFLPGWDEARQALTSALSAWRDAPSPLPVSFDSAGVKFVDKQRGRDQRLLSYEILGQSAVENARQFTVRLRLDGDDLPQLVRYIVLGRNPNWVFRLEDYESIAHWQMDMTQPEAQPRSGPDASQNPRIQP
jgi:hypothetical protein